MTETAVPTISRVDFVPIPTQDCARSTAFYADVLGLEESEHTRGEGRSEFDLSGTTLAIWDPTTAGMTFAANTNTIALYTDDVAGMRSVLEQRGVTFLGETIDTGVCHMALFADPDANPLMLHGRYVPRGENPWGN
jgi:predicted enzyme related to lactoylglutathione lyase